MDGLTGQGSGSEFNPASVHGSQEGRGTRNLFSLAPPGGGSGEYNLYPGAPPPSGSGVFNNLAAAPLSQGSGWFNPYAAPPPPSGSGGGYPYAVEPAESGGFNPFGTPPPGIGASSFNSFMGMPHRYSSPTASHLCMSSLDLNAGTAFPHMNDQDAYLHSGEFAG